jgi:RNA polymerase sigma factor (TIGR02999 family)
MRARQTCPPRRPRDEPSQHEITVALAALRCAPPAAHQDALERLARLVYGELRRVAHRQLGVERAGHTLATTDLVHEAYLRLAAQERTHWVDRAQFFALAARAMRRILVDYARRHRALRRGGVRRRISLDDVDAGELAAAERADELLVLDDALERLGALDERLARVVECRFFAGLTEAETAAVLGVTERTVARDWVKARGWLYKELRPDGS